MTDFASPRVLRQKDELRNRSLVFAAGQLRGRALQRFTFGPRDTFADGRSSVTASGLQPPGTGSARRRVARCDAGCVRGGANFRLWPARGSSRLCALPRERRRHVTASGRSRAADGTRGSGDLVHGRKIGSCDVTRSRDPPPLPSRRSQWRLGRKWHPYHRLPRRERVRCRGRSRGMV